MLHCVLFLSYKSLKIIDIRLIFYYNIGVMMRLYVTTDFAKE